MVAYSKKHSNLQIAFVNPPHADWSLAPNLTYLMFKSHYTRFGKYSDSVTWIPAPYKWNKYKNYNEVYNEIKHADIILFSCYAWNYNICDALAKIAKADGKITVLGGPHIGTNEPELLEERHNYYDFICQPTKPGEPFIEDTIDLWFEDRLNAEDIAWEIRSKKPPQPFNIAEQDYSVYEDNMDYFKETYQYATEHKLEPTIILETTRGCPYKCVFCEWGGGIGTKIYKKKTEIVQRDILALKEIGYSDAYLADANFGAFFDRDLDIYRFAWKNNFFLTDISQVKLTSYEKRKKIVDAWFDIVLEVDGAEQTNNYVVEGEQGTTDMFHGYTNPNIVPNVAIQTLSDEAMDVCGRVDLKAKEKVALAKHIRYRCEKEGIQPPGLELILGMPGSTLDDFYEEMALFYYFKNWTVWRYDYMFLPDNELNSTAYKEEHKIETVKVYFDTSTEDSNDFKESLYKGMKTEFRTMASCYSFTREEYWQMWFMNSAGNYLLQHYYDDFKQWYNPGDFCKACWELFQHYDGFEPLWLETQDILNPDTPTRSIKELNGKFRVEAISEFIDANALLLKSELLEGVLLAG